MPIEDSMIVMNPVVNVKVIPEAFCVRAVLNGGEISSGFNLIVFEENCERENLDVVIEDVDVSEEEVPNLQHGTDENQCESYY